MEHNVKLYFYNFFGQHGQYLSSNNDENQAEADKAVMNGIAAVLRNQYYGRTDRLIKNENELQQLISKAENWAKSGVPSDDQIEEEDQQALA